MSNAHILHLDENILCKDLNIPVLTTDLLVCINRCRRHLLTLLLILSHTLSSGHGPVSASFSDDTYWTTFVGELLNRADKCHCNLNMKPWHGIYLKAVIIYTLLITSY